MRNASTRGTAEGRAWAIVVAGGTGGQMTDVASTGHAPVGPAAGRGRRPTWLSHTLRGLEYVVPEERITLVTRRLQDDEDGPPIPRGPTHLEQPADRGTLPAVLLALLPLLRRDPDAEVVIVPGLHQADRHPEFAAYLRRALDTVAREPDRIVLLRYPGGTIDRQAVVARGRTLADLIRAVAPGWWMLLCEGLSDRSKTLEAYRRLSDRDLWSDLLAHRTDCCRVVRMEPGGPGQARRLQPA